MEIAGKIQALPLHALLEVWRNLEPPWALASPAPPPPAASLRSS